jgi:hypothetical protein
MSTTETQTEPETKRVVPAWRRLLVAAGWFALLLVAVSAAVYFFNRHRLVSQLDREIEKLDESDPGWRWPTPFQDRRAIPYEENSVPRILEIVNAFPPGWPDSKKTETFQDLAPNLALDGPRRELLAEVLATAPLPELRGKARELVKYPRGQIELKLAENPWAVLLPNHQKMREAANLLQLDARDLSLDGKHDEALKSARACLNVSRALEDDPFLIGQMVRIGIATVAMTMAERTMALGDAPDDALAAFQDALKHEARRTGLTVALRGERAAAQQTLTLLGAGKVTVTELEALARGGSRESSGLSWLTSFVGRELARREQGTILRLLTRMVDASRLPAKDQFAAEEEFEKQIKSSATGTIVGLVVPFVQRVTYGARRGQCQAVALRALIAVERYRLKHGKWPGKLEDTVPAFLEKVPEDPIDGKPIRYAKWAEGVVVYSIGNDRTDDGGNVTGRDNDYGFRLWDKARRRAAPPPLPPGGP